MNSKIIRNGMVLLIFFFLYRISFSQESDTTAAGVPEEKPAKDKRPVKDAFGSNWIINNQTMVVPTPHTMEFDINHRFGELKNGIKDMYGLYAPSNIRLGLSFTPIKNLQIGAGMTKAQMMYDFNLKWNPLQQTRSGSFPVFITYLGNMVIEGSENTVNWTIKDLSGNDSIVNKRYPKYTDRISYLNEIIIGRKITKQFSLQVAGSYMHYNLIDTVGNNKLLHDNMSVTAAGRVKFYGEMAAVFEYTHPLTPATNVKPNFALGFEATTSAHAFQLFISPFTNIIKQRDVMYNSKDPKFISDYAIGFNVTRLWNF